MPKPTEASLNSLRQATPELEIHGPTANELPATWLYGETITLRATGGHGRYQWLTTAPEAVTIKNQQDDSCEVAIEGTAAAPILAFSAGDAAIYKGLKGNKPLLKAADNTPRNYLEAEQSCQQAGGSLPTKKILGDILTARQPEVELWARKTFQPTLDQSLISWVKFIPPFVTGYELTTGKSTWPADGTSHFTLCQFNPATLDQAVASWVPNEAGAMPGNRFTTGLLSSQRSGDSPQLPHC